MSVKRLIVSSVLAAVLFTSGAFFTSQAAESSIDSSLSPSLLSQSAVFNPAPLLAQSVLAKTPLTDGHMTATPVSVAKLSHADSVPAESAKPGDVASDDIDDLRKDLIGLAMNLRNIRYVRGGHDPSTGFDCSGFVRYVFAHAVGIALPTNSASQFVAGLSVRRSEMKPGDLVFFRTAGRRGRGRISHVGIYVANGQFIHSPSTGKTVRVDSLDESYWAKRFAGAKRPEAIAQNG